jgi:hypothetical protein
VGRRDEFDFDDRPSVKGSIMVMTAAVVVTLALIGAVFLLYCCFRSRSCGRSPMGG